MFSSHLRMEKVEDSQRQTLGLAALVGVTPHQMQKYWLVKICNKIKIFYSVAHQNQQKVKRLDKLLLETLCDAMEHAFWTQNDLNTDILVKSSKITRLRNFYALVRGPGPET